MLLNFDTLYTKYDLKIKGVLHIGSHFGQENKIYQKYLTDKFNTVINWDGTDNSGKKLDAGIFFYRIMVDGQLITGKIIKE